MPVAQVFGDAEWGIPRSATGPGNPYVDDPRTAVTWRLIQQLPLLVARAATDLGLDDFQVTPGIVQVDHDTFGGCAVNTSNLWVCLMPMWRSSLDEWVVDFRAALATLIRDFFAERLEGAGIESPSVDVDVWLMRGSGCTIRPDGTLSPPW